MRDRYHNHTSVARVRTTRPSCTPPPTPPPPESQSVYFAIKCALFVSSRRVADVPDDTCRPITHFPRVVACMVACSSPTATPLLPGRRHELSNSGRWHRAPPVQTHRAGGPYWRLAAYVSATPRVSSPCPPPAPARFGAAVWSEASCLECPTAGRDQGAVFRCLVPARGSCRSCGCAIRVMQVMRRRRWLGCVRAADGRGSGTATCY